MVAPLIALGGRAVAASSVKGALSSALNKSVKGVVGSMSVNVTTNLPAVQKAIDGLGRNQLPFAMHRAINDAAFAVRKEIVERTYPQSFVVKNRSFAKAMFRVDKSPNKRKLVARVYDRFGKDYMVNQAEGGTKFVRGQYLAIPAQDRPVVKSKASYNRNAPRTLLQKPKVFAQDVNGQPMILERRTKKPYPLKRLYLLEEQNARIPKRFPFYERGQAVARKSFADNFTKRFQQAKRSARR